MLWGVLEVVDLLLKKRLLLPLTHFLYINLMSRLKLFIVRYPIHKHLLRCHIPWLVFLSALYHLSCLQMLLPLSYTDLNLFTLSLSLRQFIILPHIQVHFHFIVMIKVKIKVGHLLLSVSLALFLLSVFLALFILSVSLLLFILSVFLPLFI